MIMAQEKFSILVVEDNTLAGELLARCLRDVHHSATVCRDGDHALELVAANSFDLVLLDISLPGKNGLMVLETLRLRYPPTILPIIMTTGHGQSEMVVRALELGANDYVTKPYDVPVLCARVQTHLSIKRMVEEMAHLERSLAQANSRMKGDLQAAARVQETLLPRTAPTFSGGHFAWAFEPCEELAGDTLNVFALGADHVGMYLLDVSGHGVAASLLAVQLSRVLSPTPAEASLLLRPGHGNWSQRLVPPAEVAAALNRHFPFELNAEQYFTLVYGILNCRSGEFRYTCAGHPGPVFLPRRGEPKILKVTGMPIGVHEAAFEERTLHLEPGDRLYLYSDGLTDAMDATRQRFGTTRFLEALQRRREATLAESLAGVLDEVRSWQTRARDDVSVLALEWTGVSERTPQVERQSEGILACGAVTP